MTPPDAGPGTLAGWPAAAATGGFMLMLVLPAALLASLHINYASASGAAWEKVHPGSDLVLLGCAGAALRHGRPGSWIAGQLRRFPGSALFSVATLFLTAYLIVVLQMPFTPMIDTFMVPVALLITVADLTPGWKARFETVLHLFVAVNGVLGIVEFVTGWRLIPAEVGGVVQTSDIETRAFGLLGHPLASAAMAGLYSVALLVGGGRRLPPGWRAPALALQGLALGAYGGRTALVMTALCAAAVSGLAVLRFLAGRTADLRAIAAMLLLAPLGLAAVALVALSGFFDAVLNRFTDDKGSAAARHAIFDVFGYLSWPDLLFGPHADYLDSVQHLVGIEVGVESFWLGFILAYGLLPSLVFFVGYGLFMADVLRQCSPAAWVPLLFFTGIISTSISLSAKSTMLEQFVIVVVVLLPRFYGPSRHPLPAGRFIPVMP